MGVCLVPKQEPGPLAQTARSLAPPSQVTHCYTEVMDPDLAAKFEACFKKVVNSRGKVPYSTCQPHIEAMQASLRKWKLFPFVEKK